MMVSNALNPIDYLIVGHITQDLIPGGAQVGGTAVYSALTAAAMGMKVGVVTAWGEEVPLPEMENVQIFNHQADQSTTFENQYTADGRVQYVHHVAPRLDYYHIPELWRKTAQIHIAPILGEVESGMVRYFPDAFIGITPQGYLREYNADGKIYAADWPEADFVLQKCAATVISREDIDDSQQRLDELASASPVLVVTDGFGPIWIVQNGQEQLLTPARVEELDPTGAGDIFATAFFISFYKTHQAEKAAEFASRVAGQSVSKRGVAGVPTKDEIYQLLTEVR